MTPEEALKWLEDNSYDLRCENQPTGGDDYDIIWMVYSHHMAKPHHRIEGCGKTPMEAIQSAETASWESPI
jgi:hypothetical protein